MRHLAIADRQLTRLKVYGAKVQCVASLLVFARAKGDGLPCKKICRPVAAQINNKRVRSDPDKRKKLALVASPSPSTLDMVDECWRVTCADY